MKILGSSQLENDIVLLPAVGVHGGQKSYEDLGIEIVGADEKYIKVKIQQPEEFIRKCESKYFSPKDYDKITLLSGQINGNLYLLNEKNVVRSAEKLGFVPVWSGDRELPDLATKIRRAKKILVLGRAEAILVSLFANRQATVFCVKEDALDLLRSSGIKALLLETLPAGAGFGVLTEESFNLIDKEGKGSLNTPWVVTIDDSGKLQKSNKLPDVVIEDEVEIVSLVNNDERDNLPLQSLLVPGSGEILYVFFHGGLEPRPLRLPHYEWKNALIKFNGHKLFISDSTLYTSHLLKNGWYFGADSIDLRNNIKDLIKFVKDLLGVQKLIFFGSSAGGVAAFQIGAFFKDSISLGFSIQRDLSKGPVNHVPGFYKHVLGSISWDEAYKKYKDRIAVHEVLKDSFGYLGHSVWVQNSGDSEHMRDHYVPEVTGSGNCQVLKGAQNINDNLTGHLTYWGKGHPVPPISLVVGSLEAAQKTLNEGKAFTINWTENIEPPGNNFTIDESLAEPTLNNKQKYLEPLDKGYVNFSGTAPAGYGVALKIGNTYYQATQVDYQGNWSIDISFATGSNWKVQLVTFSPDSYKISKPLEIKLNVVDRKNQTYSNTLERNYSIPKIRLNLDTIGVLNSSDSSSLVHNYLEEYEKLFSSKRDQDVKIILIGATQRGLLKTLLDYFPKCKVVVIERSNKITQEFINNPRVTFISPNSYSKEEFSGIAQKYKADIVIDDGTHKWEHQKNALENLLFAVKPEGFYIIEDVHTSFGNLRERYQGKEFSSIYDVISELNTGLVAGGQSNRPKSVFEWYFRESVRSVTSIKHAIIISKNNSNVEMYPVRRSREVALATTEISTEKYKRASGVVENSFPYIANTFKELSKNNSLVSLGEVSTGYLEDARIIGRGVLITKDNFIVDESMNCVRNLNEYKKLRKIDKGLWVGNIGNPTHRIKREQGKQHILLQSAWDANYGHFLWDTLSRIELIKKVDLSGLSPLWVINKPKGGMRAVVYDALQLAGISKADVIELEEGLVVFDSVVLPGALTKHPTVKSVEAVEFMNDLAKNIPANSNERIYLSRNSYGRRGLDNESIIWPIFERYGFKKIIPESLSFVDQISLFKGAKYVAGNLGAGFSSLGFSPLGVTVIALTTPRMMHDFFYDITCLKNGRYFALQGDEIGEAGDISSNFIISPDKLESLLRKIPGL